MKQMNQLEQHIGLPLIIRTNQGIHLTDAGKSIYKDAKAIIGYSRESIERAYKTQKMKHAIIRVGTSALYPCQILMDLWNSICDRHPHFKLKVVPFEDTSTTTAFSNIGRKYDLIIGPRNSVNTAKFTKTFFRNSTVFRNYQFTKPSQSSSVELKHKMSDYGIFYS